MIHRLDGIYPQRQEGFHMQRVKLAAGVISALQARAVADISERFGRGTIHLTSRGSMEIHWLKEQDLPSVKRELGLAGLTARGACGGAVRGISCGGAGAAGFPRLEQLARRLHRHFTGNSRFEGLPKKFKIGIEADETSGRHLIQDVGLVLALEADGRARYDVWIAGGLGREPRPGFLLEAQVPEERLIPLIEAIARVYATHAPPPKRLKFLAREFGEEKLRALIAAEPTFGEELPPTAGFPEHLVPPAADRNRLTVPVFAGALTSAALRALADIAAQHADGILQVTTDQDLALLLTPGTDPTAARTEIQQSTGLVSADPPQVLRVCPGNHECAMGLAPTRDVARELAPALPATLSCALSGCPNSCSQPQLAAIGIVTARLTADESGEKTPRFNLYRRNGSGFGERVAELLTQAELFAALKAIG